MNSRGLILPGIEPARGKRGRSAVCFVALLVFWSLPAFGQEAEPSGGEKFEGQKVSKVDLTTKG